MVFYDGTSLDSLKAQEASESIRTWYQTKVNEGDLEGNNLYEGIIGGVADNGENWLWWMSYPYLGSLSGGTLSSGIEVEEYGSDSNDAVSASEYDNRWCRSGNVVNCIPKATEFNDGAPNNDENSDIYKRINRGYNLTGSFGVNDSRSQGVPFDHTALTSGTTSGSGTLTSTFNDYIVITVIDESDGAVGLYHSRLNKTDLLTNGFTIQGSNPNDFWIGDNKSTIGPLCR